MVKKLSLSIDYTGEYEFIGIACHLKDYRLCFHLNKELEFQFRKMDDFVLEDERKREHPYSVYYYRCNDTHADFCLLSNHHAEMKLIPGLRQFDYFLILQSHLSTSQKTSLIQKIKKVPNMIMAYQIDYSKMKEINHLISDLELQLMENLRNVK